MSSAIQFPVELPPVLRDELNDRFEDTRSKVEMEVGNSRRRRVFRTTPRVFEVAWMMTAAQFAIFEDWWSETIQAGALAFDIKLHDDADGTAWFTVNMTQPYKFEVMGGNADKWKITATLRSTAPSFTSRRAGTDKLKSKAQVVTFSEEKATLQVTVGLYAASNVAQISNSAYMAAIPFYSVGQISVVGYGKFYVAAASGLDFSKASQSGYVALLF